MGRGSRGRRNQDGAGSALTRGPAPSAQTNAPSSVETRSARLEQSNAGFRAELYSGQVPHPEHLERFEQLSRGATDRFITMAERQSVHRQAMERKFLNINGTTQVLGVIFAGLIVLASIGSGGFLVYHDKQVEGLASMFGPLALVAGLFIYDRRQQKEEIGRKRNAERR